MAQRRPAVMIAILCAAALAGGLVVFYRSSASGGARWPIIAIAGVVMVGLLAVVTITKARRGRGAKAPSTAESAAARLGLSYQVKGESKYHNRFGPLPGITNHGEVRHLMMGAWQGRGLTIFQHHYHVHTGQAPIPVYHTVYVTDAPPWPFLNVVRRNVLSRMLHRLGRRSGLQLEDDEFNATRSVTTDDEDFGLTLLAPDMQRFLVDKPAVAWSVQPGRVAMIYNGAMRADRIDASLDRLRAFWELVPAELGAWEAEGS